MILNHYDEYHKQNPLLARETKVSRTPKKLDPN